MSERVLARITVSALGIVLSAVTVSAQSTGGSFTEAQAERGRGLYMAQCASCHGRSLDDGTAWPSGYRKFSRFGGAPEFSR
jgi:cytochrome c553